MFTIFWSVMPDRRCSFQNSAVGHLEAEKTFCKHDTDKLSIVHFNVLYKLYSASKQSQFQHVVNYFT